MRRPTYVTAYYGDASQAIIVLAVDRPNDVQVKLTPDRARELIAELEAAILEAEVHGREEV